MALKTIIGVLEPVLHGYDDGSTAYYFNTGDAFVELSFHDTEHANACPANRRIALTVSDVPAANGRTTVSPIRPFFKVLDNG